MKNLLLVLLLPSTLFLSACGDSNKPKEEPGADLAAQMTETVDVSVPQKGSDLAAQEVNELKVVYAGIDAIQFTEYLQENRSDYKSKIKLDKKINEAPARMQNLIALVKKSCTISDPDPTEKNTIVDGGIGTEIIGQRTFKIDGEHCPVLEEEDSAYKVQVTAMNKPKMTAISEGTITVAGNSKSLSPEMIELKKVKSRQYMAKGSLKIFNDIKNSQSKVFYKMDGQIEIVDANDQKLSMTVKIVRSESSDPKEEKRIARSEATFILNKKMITVVSIKRLTNDVESNKVYFNGNEVMIEPLK